MSTKLGVLTFAIAVMAIGLGIFVYQDLIKTSQPEVDKIKVITWEYVQICPGPGASIDTDLIEDSTDENCKIYVKDAKPGVINITSTTPGVVTTVVLVKHGTDKCPNWTQKYHLAGCKISILPIAKK